MIGNRYCYTDGICNLSDANRCDERRGTGRRHLVQLRENLARVCGQRNQHLRTERGE